jgi:hypothetical protein
MRSPDNESRPRLLTRRNVIVLTGLGGIGLLAVCSRPENQVVQDPSKDINRASSPIQSPAKKQLAEEPPEGNWSRFRSINYPYQMDHPQDWSAQSTEGLGKKIDIFKGKFVNNFQTNVTVVAEPAGSWVNEDDYRDNLINQLTIRSQDGKLIFQPGWWKVKIGSGREIYVVGGIKPPLIQQTGIIIAARNIWQITLSSADVKLNEISKDVQTFEKMLSTFNFRS